MLVGFRRSGTLPRRDQAWLACVDDTGEADVQSTCNHTSRIRHANETDPEDG